MVNKEEAKQEPVAWGTEVKYGKLFFRIGVQSFAIDYTPEDEPDCSAGNAMAWMEKRLREALSKLAHPAPEAKQEPVEPKCVVIVEVFGKDWRLEYMSLPVGRHKLYPQQFTYTHPAPSVNAQEGGGCTLAGPGRGDCEHSVGIPGKSIPGQHDGPDDTVDAHGKPNGWCWSCWKSQRISELEAENANLRTVMMAAAVEIQEHWDAHCDEEGYGPANLLRRLENGYPEQYGYNAETVVRMERRIAELEAALDVAHGVLEQIQRMGYSDVGDKMMVDEAIAKLKEVRRD